jgi:predicted DNA-binding protein (MmcQ/YjbR family)
MFCVLDTAPVDSGGSGRLSFKVEETRFLEFTDRPGIIPAPYMARAHWISLTTPKALSASETKALIRRSYELVFAKLPKTKQRELGAG